MIQTFENQDQFFFTNLIENHGCLEYLRYHEIIFSNSLVKTIL